MKKIEPKEDLFAGLFKRPTQQELKQRRIDRNEGLKEAARSLKKGEVLNVHDFVPPELERWLKQYCRRHGISLYLPERSYYNFSTITEESRRAERERQLKESQFWDDYFNSPG